MKLRDPEHCPKGHRGIVIDSRRRRQGFRRRLHFCSRCQVTWESFQTLIDPRHVYLSRREHPSA
jgi:hypothetical protein